MPDPLSGGASIVDFSLNLASGLASAEAARRYASYIAAVGEQNAQILDYSAADAVSRGQHDQGVVLLKGGAKVGAQKAAYANSGVSVQSGSALGTYGDTAMLTELDRRIVESNARREAWGYSTKATQLRFGAKLARETGDAKYSEAVLAGVTGAARAGIPLLRLGGMSVDAGNDYTSGPYAVPGMLGET